MLKRKKRCKANFKILEASNNNELNEKIIIALQEANSQNKRVGIKKFCYAVISIS